MKSHLLVIMSVCAVFIHFSRHVEGYIEGDLYCFTCMNLDCNSTDKYCDEIRGLLESELKTMYVIDDNLYKLKRCPNHWLHWRTLQMEAEPCPEEKNSNPTCTLGRMQIIMKSTNKDGKEVIRYTYGTVLGCARLYLLKRIAYAYGNGKGCDSHLTGKSVGPSRTVQMEFEHCMDNATLCRSKDFCIKWQDSEVKPWVVSDEMEHYLQFLYGIGLIFGFVVLMIIIVAILVYCKR